MKTIHVLFDSHHFQTPQIWTESIIRMTPNCLGIWKNIKFTYDPNEADYYFIIDGESQNWPDMDKKAIYTFEHPFTPYSPRHNRAIGKKALLKLPLTQFVNPGECWLGMNYDELSQLKSPIKIKDLSCIATYQTHHPMYAQRQVFLRELVTKYSNINLDIYGRPVENYEADTVLKPYYRGCLGNNKYDATKGEHIVGKDKVLYDSRYSIEYDVGPTEDYYWSERVYDAFLMWCMPIYFGSNKMHEVLPPKSFHYFDQHNLKDVDKINQIVNSNSREENIESIAYARDLMLNKYQIWSYCHFIVNNINDMINNPNATFKKWINS